MCDETTVLSGAEEYVAEEYVAEEWPGWSFQIFKERARLGI